MTDYRTIVGAVSNEIIVSRSRFIATAKGIENTEEAIQFIKEISKRYYDATHNCYAYIADIKMQKPKFSDDKEPQGTAGQPILEVLKKKKLALSVIVVTRYFGGIKLGTGGLVNAYTRAAKECLERADIVNCIPAEIYRTEIDYSMYNKIEQCIISAGGEMTNIEYTDRVAIKYLIPMSKRAEAEESLDSIGLGRIRQEKINTGYIKVRSKL